MGVLAKIASRPAVRETAGIIADIAIDRIRTRRGGKAAPAPSSVAGQGERAVAVDAAADAIAASPVLVNAINAEPWYQSRIKVGLIIAALGWLLNRFNIDLGLTDEDKELATSLVIGFGGGLAGIGRWFSGLKPMTWNPLTWFGFKR